MGCSATKIVTRRLLWRPLSASAALVASEAVSTAASAPAPAAASAARLGVSECAGCERAPGSETMHESSQRLASSPRALSTAAPMLERLERSSASSTRRGALNGSSTSCRCLGARMAPNRAAASTGGKESAATSADCASAPHDAAVSARTAAGTTSKPCSSNATARSRLDDVSISHGAVERSERATAFVLTQISAQFVIESPVAASVTASGRALDPHSGQRMSPLCESSWPSHKSASPPKTSASASRSSVAPQHGTRKEHPAAVSSSEESSMIMPSQLVRGRVEPRTRLCQAR